MTGPVTVFRPRGALGPLTDASGEVIARSGRQHIASGHDKITAGQQACLDAVESERRPRRGGGRRG
jgi:hypothetical protein